jgi:hypothetical protein
MPAAAGPASTANVLPEPKATQLIVSRGDSAAAAA